MATFLFLIGCCLISAAGFTVSLSVGLAVTGIVLCGISVGLALAEGGS